MVRATGQMRRKRSCFHPHEKTGDEALPFVRAGCNLGDDGHRRARVPSFPPFNRSSAPPSEERRRRKKARGIFSTLISFSSGHGGFPSVQILRPPPLPEEEIKLSKVMDEERPGEEGGGRSSPPPT